MSLATADAPTRVAKFACHAEHEPGAGHHLYTHGRSAVLGITGGPDAWGGAPLPADAQARYRCCCMEWGVEYRLADEDTGIAEWRYHADNRRPGCIHEHHCGTGHHLHATGRHPLGKPYSGPTWWGDQRLRILEDLTIRCCCGEWENTSTSGLHYDVEHVRDSWRPHTDPSRGRRYAPERGTQYGWKPERGDLAYAWVTPPAWGGNPPPYSSLWNEPVKVTGWDDGIGSGPRWLIGSGSVIDQATSNLVPVRALPDPVDDEAFDDLLQLLEHMTSAGLAAAS